jgi:hypothetical protein
MLSRTIESQYPAFLSLLAAEKPIGARFAGSHFKIGNLLLDRRSIDVSPQFNIRGFLLKVASLLFASVSLFVDHNDLDAHVQATDKL